MKRLIKDKDIILDGTAPRYLKEQEAFEKLEIIEGILEKYQVESFDELILALALYSFHSVMRK